MNDFLPPLVFIAGAAVLIAKLFYLLTEIRDELVAIRKILAIKDPTP